MSTAMYIHFFQAPTKKTPASTKKPSIGVGGNLKVHYPVKKVHVAGPIWGFQILLTIRWRERSDSNTSTMEK